MVRCKGTSEQSSSDSQEAFERLRRGKSCSKPPSCVACKVNVPVINVFIVLCVLLISVLPACATFLMASGTLLLFLLLLLGDEDALRGHGHGNAIKTLSP